MTKSLFYPLVLKLLVVFVLTQVLCPCICQDEVKCTRILLGEKPERENRRKAGRHRELSDHNASLTPGEGEKERRLCRSVLDCVKSKESVARPSESSRDKVAGGESDVS